MGAWHRSRKRRPEGLGAEWVFKKPATYCREHGERIVGYMNLSEPFCRDCTKQFLQHAKEISDAVAEEFKKHPQ